MRKLGLVVAVLMGAACGGGSSQPVGNGSGSGGGSSPDGGGTASVTLSVAIAGKGSVTVAGLSLNCTANCVQAVAQGSAVHLDATPADGMVFSGWSGACMGTGGCDLMLTHDAAVTATFGAAPLPDSCAGLMPTMPPPKIAMISTSDIVPDTCGYAVSDGSANIYMQSPFVQSANFFVPLQAGITIYSHQMISTGTFYAFAPDGSILSTTMYGPAAVPGIQANGGIVVVNATCSVSKTASARYIDDFGHVVADVALPDQPCIDGTTFGPPQLAAIVDAQNRLFLLNYSAGVVSPNAAGNSTARWFDSAGKALTPWFDVGVVGSRYPVYPVFPLIGGGVALRNGAAWVSTVASGAATTGPAPLGFESGKLALVVRGGKAYAMEPYRYESGSIDVIAPDGMNCGTLTTQSGMVAVGRDGSIIVVPPDGRDRTTNLCPVTWYPQVLK
jgi:Divergent InlB B-repeat domain